MALTRSSGIIPDRYSSVVPVDLRPSMPPVIVTIALPYGCIYMPVVMIIRTVIGISYGVVKPSVRRCIYLAEPEARPCKESVVWSPYVVSIKVIYIANGVVEVSQIVIVDI